MNPPPSFPGFRRSSLADQAAAVLGAAIRDGTWGNVLPGEHELSRRLAISRPSVRAALARLAEDGLITIRQGSRTRVNPDRRPRHPGVSPTVYVVAPVSRDAFGRGEHPMLLEMRAQLAAHGIGWEELFDATLGGEHPDRRLTDLTTGRRGICWLLTNASAAMQRWFEKERLPVLLLGSCHTGVNLPSVDTNYGAVGWHVAGRMAQCGHRHAAIILPTRPAAGDLACRDGLMRYAAQRPDRLSVTELPADATRSSLQSKLKRLIERQPRPTVIFTTRPEYTMIVYICLLQYGLRIPQDMSLVSRDTHMLLELALPELTRYQSATVRLATQAMRLVQSLLAGHDLQPRPTRIMPTFVPGATLGRAPSA